MARPRNIILTGIPRSGTAMLTALVDSLPDSVALNEPRWQYDWMVRHRQTTPADFAAWLIDDFHAVRQKLLAGTPVPERRLTDGTAVTNYYRAREETRTPEQNFEVISFTRSGLSPDFTLGMKHNGPYLSSLRKIAETGAFTVIAIVRNPVGVIASWHNVPIALGRGEMPGAMVYWKEMIRLTTSTMDVLEKQVRMYDLICRRLQNLQDKINIVRYEDITDDLGILSRILGHDVSYFAPRIKKRDASFYGDTTRIAEAVRRFGSYYRHFYPEL